MAFRDRAGRAGATTRQSVFLAGVMVIAAVSLATWIGGLHHVDTDEAAHGWLWDAAIGNVHFDMRIETVVELQRDPRIAASTRYVTGQAVLDGKSTAVSSFDPAGMPPPQLLCGRLPARTGEVALGRTLARRRHLGLGDSVSLSVAGLDYDPNGTADATLELRVVGIVLLPPLGENDLGDDALVTQSTITRVGGSAPLRLSLVRFDPAQRPMLRSVATTPKSASRTSFHPRSPTSGTYPRFRSSARSSHGSSLPRSSWLPHRGPRGRMRTISPCSTRSACRPETGKPSFAGSWPGRCSSCWPRPFRSECSSYIAGGSTRRRPSASSDA